MVMTESEIYQMVRNIVAESLGAELEEIVPEASLTEDLSAESIDFLDIAFHLEKTFHIKIDSNEFMPTGIVSGEQGNNGTTAGNGLVTDDGKLTDAGMAALHARLPYGHFDLVDRTRAVSDVLSVITVDTLIHFVFDRLENPEKTS